MKKWPSITAPWIAMAAVMSGTLLGLVRAPMRVTALSGALSSLLSRFEHRLVPSGLSMHVQVSNAAENWLAVYLARLISACASHHLMMARQFFSCFVRQLQKLFTLAPARTAPGWQSRLQWRELTQITSPSLVQTSPS